MELSEQRADGPSFGTSLAAVFLAGVVTSVIKAAVLHYRSSSTDARLVATFLGILLSAVVLKVVLGLLDADVSLTVAVVTVVVGTIVSLAVAAATTPARLQAETHAGRTTPGVLPLVGFGFNVADTVVWIAVLFGQALIVMGFARRSV